MKKIWFKTNKERVQENKKEIDIEEIKQLLHTAIDKLKNEKDLRLFCLTMGETIFEYFREVVIPKEF